MPTHSLPEHPDLGKLRSNAKTLRDLVRASVPGALALVAEHYAAIEAGSSAAQGFSLAEAQLVTARNHAFSSWATLKRHVEFVALTTRQPHCAQPSDNLADEMTRLACLNYGNDDPAFRQAAEALLREHPELPRASLYAAIAANDVEATRAQLTRGNANTEGGPLFWVPLLYASYSRLRDGDATVEIVRMLLGAGADPNAGYLWSSLPSPFTALTGVFGGGEGYQLRHPKELELARLLLQAGADPNDSQVLYNRGLGSHGFDDTEMLQLLLEHGLGHGDGGPWHRALTVEHQTPEEQLQDELMHAALRGLPRRARLLLDHGADPNGTGQHSVYRDYTATTWAIRNGHDVVAAMLLAAGGRDTVTQRGKLIGRILAGDAEAVSHATPANLAKLRASRPHLVAEAAETHRPAAARLAVALGFDVNHMDQATALHEAALQGDRPMVEALLDLGADRTLKDPHFDATPAGWADHAGHTELAELLSP